MQTTMEIKRKLRTRCKEQLDAMASDFRKEMEDAQQSANEYGAPKDRYDAYRTQLLRKRDMFGQQLAKLNVQLDVLDKIDPDRKCKVVEFGALVVTSRQKLFIATGLGKIELEGETYYAISAAVPIFKAMEGKRAGDEFVFNDQKTTIVEIL
jgi:transcription elongation GreA/GreB family factor